MSAWPEYVTVEADGYGVGQDNDVSRTPFDDGLIRQERRYTAALTVRRIKGLFEDDDDYARFRAWASEYAGRWFTWTDPEDGVTREARVRGGAGGIAYRARTAGGRRTWELECEIEGYMARVIAE